MACLKSLDSGDREKNYVLQEEETVIFKELKKLLKWSEVPF